MDGVLPSNSMRQPSDKAFEAKRSIVFSIDRLNRTPNQVLLNSILKCSGINLKSLIDRIDGAVDHVVGVRKAHNERRSQNSTPNQLLKEQSAKRLRRLSRLVGCSIDQVRRPPDHLEIVGNAVACYDLIDPGSKALALSPEMPNNVLLMGTIIRPPTVSVIWWFPCITN